MQTLGNLVLGAVLAGISLGPAPWADASLLVHTGLSKAVVIIAETEKPGSPLDHPVATARAAFAHLPDAGLHH